jgi:hypothetical protein
MVTSMQSPHNERKSSLPTLDRVASEKELVAMLHQSLTKRGEMLELAMEIGLEGGSGSSSNSSSDGEVRLRLQAVVGRRAGEEAPTWYLYYDGPDDSKLEWIHQSGDMAHIHQLLNNAAQQFDRDPALFESGNQPSFRPYKEEQAAEGDVRRPNSGNGAGTSGTNSTTFANSTTNASAVDATPVEEERGVLDGDLTRLPVEALLQSITASKMTGKLECKNKEKSISVFFEDGNPKNAYTGSIIGEEAVIELMTWKEGLFSFFPNQTIEERTIIKPITALMLEAATLTDFSVFLDKAGLTGESILARTVSALSEAEFEDKLARAVPIEMIKQKKFYQIVDNKTSLSELIKRYKYNRSTWLPLVYNMVSSGILTILKPTTSKSKATTASDLELNRSTIDSFARSHIYSDSGVISYVAFLYFIEQEFYRYECFRSSFSLVLFRAKMRQKNADGTTQEMELDRANLQELMGRVNLTKRKADLLAHYQQDSYALLLPHTNLQGVTAFAGRLVGALMTAPFANSNGQKLVLTVGIASLPENCADWVSLVAHMHNNQRRFE